MPHVDSEDEMIYADHIDKLEKQSKKLYDEEDEEEDEDTCTEKILHSFTTAVNPNKEYTFTELSHMLRLAYKMHTYAAKDTKKEKKSRAKGPRAPTQYNIFVKENMPIVKQQNPHMTHPNRMKLIGEMWQTHKKELAAAQESEPSLNNDDNQDIQDNEDNEDDK